MNGWPNDGKTIPSAEEYFLFLKRKIENAEHNNFPRLIKHNRKLEEMFMGAYSRSDMHHAIRNAKLKKRN